MCFCFRSLALTIAGDNNLGRGLFFHFFNSGATTTILAGAFAFRLTGVWKLDESYSTAVGRLSGVDGDESLALQRLSFFSFRRCFGERDGNSSFFGS